MMSNGGGSILSWFRFRKVKALLVDRVDWHYFSLISVVPMRNYCLYVCINIDGSVPNLIILGSSIQILPEHKLVEESWSEFPAARTRLLKMVISL